MNNKQEAYDAGYARGVFFRAGACCVECALDCEQNDRQSADWCYGDCATLNGLPEDGRDPETGLFALAYEDGWEAYENGITDAIMAAPSLPETHEED